MLPHVPGIRFQPQTRSDTLGIYRVLCVKSGPWYHPLSRLGAKGLVQVEETKGSERDAMMP